MPTEITRDSLSVEYLQAIVSANITLGTQVVKMAVVGAGEDVEQSDFATIGWFGATGTTCTARKTPAAYAIGVYDVYVQVVDSPEIPVLYAGRLTVT